MSETTTNTAVATASRSDLRNVAIVAHVDHGKTTLVDAMLKQTNSFAAHGDVADRVMDSGDLEREKGITILAKNTTVFYDGPSAKGETITINVIDTPGHADFGGEVERGLSMVDGVVLLVDASEGPLPQTRFVLRKALGKGMPVILVVNKTDRSDARIAEVVDETYELFMELLEDNGMDAGALEFPIVYSNGKTGQASLPRPADGTSPDSPDLAPLVTTLLDTIPAPTYDAEEPLRAQVTNLDASPFLGRLALLRIHSGEMKRGQQVAWCKVDGSIQRVKITELLVTEGLDRTSADRRRAVHLDHHRDQPLAALGQVGQEAHRPADQEPARPGAGRQRLGAHAAHRPSRHLGDAGPWRAGAGHPRRAAAPRGVRAHRRPPDRRHQDHRRQAARARRARHDRHPGRVR